MKITLAILLIILTSSTFAQDYKFDYDKLCQEDKRAELLPLLKEWEQNKPDDPELYVAYFNYYFQESKQEVIQLSDTPGQGDNLKLTDSLGNESGYMYGKILYQDSLFNLGIEYVDKGLSKHPRRLDMYFGKIYVLREKGNIKEYVSEIIKVIELHKNKKSNWLWSNNEPVEDGDDLFKGSIQSYCYALFNLEETYIKGIEMISKKMMLLYPNDVENYSNLGVCKLINKEYKEALETFLQAKEINPTDTIVLANIAYAYMQLNEKENSLSYYKKVSDLGNEQEKAFANQQIKLLEKQ